MILGTNQTCALQLNYNYSATLYEGEKCKLCSDVSERWSYN